MKRMILNERVYDMIFEKRRNPEENNYLSNLKREIEKIIGKIKGNLNKIYVSFREGHHVTSINLKSRYRFTPSGLYCYPLSLYGKKLIEAFERFLRGDYSIGLFKSLVDIFPWFPPKTSSMYFFEKTGGNIFNVEDRLDMDRAVKILENNPDLLRDGGLKIIKDISRDKQPGLRFTDHIEPYDGSLKKNTDYASLYGFLHTYAKSHRHSSKFFKLLGYDGLIDLGGGIIHLSIMVQAVFFTPKKHLDYLGQITLKRKLL